MVFYLMCKVLIVYHDCIWYTLYTNVCMPVWMYVCLGLVLGRRPKITYLVYTTVLFVVLCSGDKISN